MKHTLKWFSKSKGVDFVSIAISGKIITHGFGKSRNNIVRHVNTQGELGARMFFTKTYLEFLQEKDLKKIIKNKKTNKHLI